MSEDVGPDLDEMREYLFDMLSQLARIADMCEEPALALVLNTIVASRSGNRLHKGDGKVVLPPQE